MRNAFASEITKLAEADPRIHLLSGDIGNRLFNDFQAKCPGRFFNCGVAEANMISVGAGMALCGLKPVAYTITTFITARCFEQIKLDVCYNEAPLVIVGVGSGLAYASLGPTHHAFEDMAILRTLPGLTILAPADPPEVRTALRAALAHGGPVYMRIGKKGEPTLMPDPPPFQIGKGRILRKGADACLLSTGVVLSETLHAAEALAARGIQATVVHMPTVKPLDAELLGDMFRTHRVIGVVEEHSRIGGFSSAVLEWAADAEAFGPRLLRFGLPDAFIHESGEQEYARGFCGIRGEQIAENVARALEP
ncbi:MAG: transketolase [Kiritimatiellae bacterium]|nr:transketolase [Kiritimatiellia bacterium]MDW8458701.1 transketolase C-terminal domain-containing protein [Verrucomicrobiota bacterium]